ncbi:MAG: DUF2924 domain-containing protein [Minisyncoccia bacterium]
MSTISKQIVELQALPAAVLAARYVELFGTPPRVRNVAWLRRRLSWAIQARELGELGDRARTRLDELVAAIDLPLATPAARPRPKPAAAYSDATTPRVGTVFTREWRGTAVRVEVVDGGFLTNGIVHGSLTAAVRAITNANWNPKIFFGLVKRGAAS